ncbi:uncharacterized protein LOC141724151 [Apium graveolens]|uniref:uncharacterized protein LOC141724151 n=1 Tax=Apium graveolens TaxID=4045 RepID=UPI003D7B2B49
MPIMKLTARKRVGNAQRFRRMFRAMPQILEEAALGADPVIDPIPEPEDIPEEDPEEDQEEDPTEDPIEPETDRPVPIAVGSPEPRDDEPVWRDIEMYPLPVVRSPTPPMPSLSPLDSDEGEDDADRDHAEMETKEIPSSDPDTPPASPTVRVDMHLRIVGWLM